MSDFILFFFATRNSFRQKIGLHLVVRLSLVVDYHFVAMMLFRRLSISKFLTCLVACRRFLIAELLCCTWRTSARGDNIYLLRLRVLLDELIIWKVAFNRIMFRSLFALRRLRLKSHHCLHIFMLHSSIWGRVDLWWRLHVVSQVLHLLKVFLAPHSFARLFNLSDALD